MLMTADQNVTAKSRNAVRAPFILAPLASASYASHRSQVKRISMPDASQGLLWRGLSALYTLVVSE